MSLPHHHRARPHEQACHLLLSRPGQYHHHVHLSRPDQYPHQSLLGLLLSLSGILLELRRLNRGSVGLTQSEPQAALRSRHLHLHLAGLGCHFEVKGLLQQQILLASILL